MLHSLEIAPIELYFIEKIQNNTNMFKNIVERTQSSSLQPQVTDYLWEQWVAFNDRNQFLTAEQFRTARKDLSLTKFLFIHNPSNNLNPIS